jgi:hypothetical protein
MNRGTLSPRRRLEVEVIAAVYLKNLQPLNSMAGNHQVGVRALWTFLANTPLRLLYQDPYVLCCLVPGELSSEQTQVHLSGGIAPCWNECMDNRLQMKFVDTCTHLSVQVTDPSSRNRTV